MCTDHYKKIVFIQVDIYNFLTCLNSINSDVLLNANFPTVLIF